MVKQELDNFMQSFTDECKIKVQQPFGALVDIFEVKYEYINNEGVIVLVLNK